MCMLLRGQSAHRIARAGGQGVGKAALMLRLKRLMAMEKQVNVRQAVEREQADIMSMPDRSYRKFARQCWRQGIDDERAVRSPCPSTPLHLAAPRCLPDCLICESKLEVCPGRCNAELAHCPAFQFPSNLQLPALFLVFLICGVRILKVA